MTIEVGNVAGALTVNNQIADFGAKTLSGAGVWHPTVAVGQITQAEIIGGTLQGTGWQIQTVDGGLYKTHAVAVGSDSISAGTLICSYNNGADTATVTINAIANTYSFATQAELNALIAISAAIMSGKTMLQREGTTLGKTTFTSKLYTSETRLKGPDVWPPNAFFTYEGVGAQDPTIHIDRVTNLTIERLDIQNTGTARDLVTYGSSLRTASGTSGSKTITVSQIDSNMRNFKFSDGLSWIKVLNYDGLGNDFESYVRAADPVGTVNGQITLNDAAPASFSGKSIQVGSQASTNFSGACVRIKGGSPITSNIKVWKCHLHGTYYDPLGDYEIHNSYRNTAGVITNSTCSNITVSQNVFQDLFLAIGTTAQGYMRITDNRIDKIYYDAIKPGFSASSTEITVSRNYITRPTSGGDEDDPHFDAIQAALTSATDMTGYVMEQNVFFTNATLSRGSGHFILFNGNNFASFTRGAIFRGNVCVGRNAQQGIAVEDGAELRFYQNSILTPSGPSSNQMDIYIGGNTTPTAQGESLSYGNIAAGIGISGSATGGGTLTQSRDIEEIPANYGDYLVGPTFEEPIDFDDCMTRFAIIGGPAPGKAGAINSGYCTFPTNMGAWGVEDDGVQGGEMPDPTGYSINSAYEVP